MGRSVKYGFQLARIRAPTKSSTLLLLSETTTISAPPLCRFIAISALNLWCNATSADESVALVLQCRDLIAQIPVLSNQKMAVKETKAPFDPFAFERRVTPEIELGNGVHAGGEQTVRVVVTQAAWDKVAPKIRPKDDVKKDGQK